jgi:hypothetical protein
LHREFLAAVTCAPLPSDGWYIQPSRYLATTEEIQIQTYRIYEARRWDGLWFRHSKVDGGGLTFRQIHKMEVQKAYF